MKYLLFISVIFLSSCFTLKIMPLTQTYPFTPMIFTSDKPFDKAWDNLVDVFAQKGLSIRIIDKSSGLIISSRSLLSVTTESKTGGLTDPSAYIAVPYYLTNKNRIPITNPYVGPYVNMKTFKINPVYGDWNVRIKPNASGGSTINVNITDIYYDYIDQHQKEIKNTPLKFYRSTGIFEKDLSDLVK